MALAMKPLVTNHRVLTWLSLCSADENTSKREKRCYILFAAINYFIFIFFLACSIAYFFTFIQTDLEKSLGSLFQIAACSGIIYMLIVIFFLRHKISAIFIKLSDVYKASKNLFEFYWMVISIQSFTHFTLSLHRK